MALKEEDRYQFDIADFFNRTRPDPSIEEQKNAIDEIFDALIDNNRYFQAITYLRRMVGESEKLSLEFNINSKTTAKQGADYNDVRNLSLGQKVVAMLDFIFGYGDFVDDHRPILIDQPEDNLDSQYILAMYYPDRFLTIHSERHLTYFCEKAGIGDDMAREHYLTLEKNASDCISCGHCNSRCPFMVDQMNRMQEIKEYFGHGAA